MANMRAIEPLEVGLLFWATENAEESLQNLRRFGVSAGQLGVSGELSLAGKAEQWQQALGAQPEVAILTAVCSFQGEDYADIPTVTRTVGLVPRVTRAERLARTKAVADFTSAIGIASVACHVGVVPPSHETQAYGEVRDLTRELCDYCADRGQTFALETGQESAEHLLAFIEDVDRPNLKVNFDPANMILYGTGNPIEALEQLRHKVISTHCKDGDGPDPAQPDALGHERTLGQGSVGIPAFVEKLRQIGYTGMLSVEREEPNLEVRAVDIATGIQLLRQLTGRS